MKWGRRIDTHPAVLPRVQVPVPGSKNGPGGFGFRPVDPDTSQPT